MVEPAGQGVVILLPVFNDWESVRRLLPVLDQHLLAFNRKARVLLVDDGSTADAPTPLTQDPLAAIEPVEILHLRRNLGHQRAIAIGLYHVHEFLSPSVVVVMDADGEDRPEDVPALLDEFEKCGGREIIFAARTKRLESAVFRIFYQLYRITHRALTGIPVRVGNFSVLPAQALTRLMVVSELWNHYAAAVFKARLPHRTLPLARGQRLAGESHMNFLSLLVHGLSAISVFSEAVSARLLAASALFALVGLILMPAVSAFAAGLLLVLVLQAITFAVLFCFLIVSGRSAMGFLPTRDARYFILGKTTCSNAVSPLNALCTAVTTDIHEATYTESATSR
jgi:hypothetical protein